MPAVPRLECGTAPQEAAEQPRPAREPAPKAVLDELNSTVRGSKVTEVTLPLSRNLFIVFDSLRLSSDNNAFPLGYLRARPL